MALLWPDFGPDLANRTGPHKGYHSMLHVGQIIIPHVPDVGRIWASNVLLSGWTLLYTICILHFTEFVWNKMINTVDKNAFKCTTILFLLSG